MTVSMAAAIVAFALSAQQARAQDTADGTEAPAEKQDAGALYVPYGNLKDADPQQVEAARKLGETLAVDLLTAYEKAVPDPEFAERVARGKKNADDIADQSIAGERDKVLEFLGISPKRRSNLYYFVSWSMPLEMLRSYAVEAMWSGGTLIFRGAPPGRSLGDFVSEDLTKLNYGKGASANISIDPRMYDAYQVTTVPTIVLTTYRVEMQCTGIEPRKFKYRGQDLQYNTCPPLDPAKYSKVSGAVTANYALQQFLDDGMEDATPYIKALARGFALGDTPAKEQKPFTGKWEDFKSPSERLKEEEGIRKAMADALAAKALQNASALPPQK
ncbi:TrbC family F-type conjugative pilus assembly protein [Variovorax sp. WDL1]|uniref:TrbC family F-type conjugative pilus assembly protein n=2 Tax=Variovorax TaxID=34072 RepID=UPI0018DD69D8|nr:TrbC family F-type conjugative pilus assembly protein [Variovorax sp. WDL1]